MTEFYLPTLHSFAMNNPFTGSSGNLRFKIVPKVTKKPNSKEVDFDASCIEVEVWHGLFCYEKSQIEERKVFPMSAQGREDLRSYLIASI